MGISTMLISASNLELFFIAALHFHNSNCLSQPPKADLLVGIPQRRFLISCAQVTAPDTHEPIVKALSV